MLFNKNKNFCDINPMCFAISEQKEILKRHIKNAMDKTPQAHTLYKKKLPNVLSYNSSHLIKHGKGIDPVLQKNKAVNIKIACKKLNGMIIRPGEEFSFWRTIGKTTKRKGYRKGRVLVQSELKPDFGGGLCNLANTINLLVLHSPMKITELHTHSDALAPDAHGRVPFSSGTSISYNYVDYRFKNTTKQNLQLFVWCADNMLHGELRNQRPFPMEYDLVEEDHHFHKEGDTYYRISKIYQTTTSKKTGKVVKKDLIWDNHSKVLFDYSQIPPDQIR